MFPEAGLLSSALPPLLSDYATRRMRDRGVRVLPSHQIKSAAVLENGQLELRMGDLTNVLKKESASNGKGSMKKGSAKLDEVNGGILADSKMHVKDDIWAAGDVCSYDDPWEHAQITGRVAGENMTGGNKTFFHEGAFVSIFGGGDQISAVGDVDSSLDTISYLIEGTGPDEARDGDAPMKSVVFYLANCRHSSERRIVGILFYNLYEGLDLEMARKIIKDGKEISNQETFADLARLFGIIHDDLPEVKEEKELIEPEKEVLVEKESKV
uniref:Mitochondrial apoptosis-inducing factor C-terminal domain-containing protein n=1 Tax=Ditylenchus dipsaci TaxID=166011 RepID=A0A915D0Q8_9BILA